MRIDDICSPGLVPNTHRLRQEVIRAISFAETIKSPEKAVELQMFFREAIAYLDREILTTDLPEATEQVSVDTSAESPFDEVETEVVEPVPEPKPKAAKGGKK